MKTIADKSLLLIAGLAFSAAAIGQSVTIQFSPNGTGSTGEISVNTFDWIPGNAISIKGAPAGGLTAGSKMDILSQSKLGVFVTPTGLVAVPSGTEFTFVYGLPVVVTSVSPAGTNGGNFALDNTSQNPNFVELWTSAPDSNMLAGTGFNNSTRILYGRILDASGTISVASLCGPLFGGGPTTQFDQFPSPADNNYPGVSTVCSTGSSNLSIDVLYANADYFPGFTPDVINTTKSFFNTSHITPFTQNDPSALFIRNGSGFDGTTPEATYPPNLGTANGAVTATDRDFQNQADSNESFQLGTVVAGACRVTYGGNDKNGNIDPNKFGSACSSVTNKTENCYTVGGQAGAPTADPAQGGPFGEHTHHQVSGPAGDFVFHAGTHSAPKTTRITATACKDPDACQPAAANARFKQIDFEGTGSFRTLDATAQAYLAAHGGGTVLPDNQDTRIYYFRVDMDDLGEPGDKWGAAKYKSAAQKFFDDDQNNPLATSDPTFFNYFGGDKKAACSASPDVYQFLICKDATPCGPETPSNPPIYQVRAFLTGGNIQIHPIIK